MDHRPTRRTDPVPPHPHAPRTGAESYASIVLPLADARKIFLLNRGIWDSIATAGPSVSYAITEADVDTYIDAAGEFLDELIG